MYSNCRVRGQDLLKLLLLAYDLTDPLHQALSSMAISYVRAHTLPAFKQRWGASTCVCKKRYIATMQGTRSGCSEREPKCVADRFYFEGTRGGLLAKAARSGQLDPKTAGSIAKTVQCYRPWMEGEGKGQRSFTVFFLHPVLERVQRSRTPPAGSTRAAVLCENGETAS